MSSPNPNSIIIITPPPHPHIVITYPSTLTLPETKALIQEALQLDIPES